MIELYGTTIICKAFPWIARWRLDEWVRTGLVKPTYKATGKGDFHLWDYRSAVLTGAFGLLMKFGLIDELKHEGQAMELNQFVGRQFEHDDLWISGKIKDGRLYFWSWPWPDDEQVDFDEPIMLRIEIHSLRERFNEIISQPNKEFRK